VFIAWLKSEVVTRKSGEVVDRADIAEHILQLAERGAYAIYTSALTLAEVHQKRGHARLSEQEDDEILLYFDRQFIELVDVDKDIGGDANRLARRHGLRPNDAIHVACAVRAGCEVVLAFDDQFTSKNGLVPGIRIEEPQKLGQQIMPLERGPTGGGQT